MNQSCCGALDEDSVYLAGKRPIRLSVFSCVCVCERGIVVALSFLKYVYVFIYLFNNSKFADFICALNNRLVSETAQSIFWLALPN